MNPTKRLLLGNDTIQLVSCSVMLELNACGRGFITARTEQNYTGRPVRLDIGYGNDLVRWFTGYVERSQPAENGSVRLLIREMAGILDHPFPCSFQHPTMRTVTQWLSETSGLEIILPDNAAYTDRPVPHFTHSGTGYELLASLGRIFSVPDYIWHPLPDGGIMAAAAAQGMFSGRPVTIPHEFSQASTGGHSMTLPMIQTLRPGVEVNGQRLTMVMLEDDNMTITWTPRNKATGAPLQKSPFRRQAEKAFPELASGLHLPKLARVEAPTEAVSAGNIADPFRPRYAVNLQLLDENGNPAADTPVYNAVPLPVPMAGSESGMFQFPPPGTLVEVGFVEGRADKPFIRQIMAEGHNLPDVKPGEQLQQQRDGVSQRVTVAGDWERQTDQRIQETSRERVVSADEETRSLTSRETTIQATDTTTVLGVSTLQAGAVTHITEESYSISTGGHMMVVAGTCERDVEGDTLDTVGGSLTEKIKGVRHSIAQAQKLVGDTVKLGNEGINVLTMLTDLADVVEELADITASHTHPKTGTSPQAAQFSRVAQECRQLKNKYSPIIE